MIYSLESPKKVKLSGTLAERRIDLLNTEITSITTTKTFYHLVKVHSNTRQTTKKENNVEKKQIIDIK